MKFFIDDLPVCSFNLFALYQTYRSRLSFRTTAFTQVSRRSSVHLVVDRSCRTICVHVRPQAGSGCNSKCLPSRRAPLVVTLRPGSLRPGNALRDGQNRFITVVDCVLPTGDDGCLRDSLQVLNCWAVLSHTPETNLLFTNGA